MVTQQTELSSHLSEILRKSERRVQIINYVLAGLLLTILIWAFFAAWRNNQQERIDSITLVPGSVKIVSPIALCPGDVFVVSYTLDIVGTGVVVEDDSVRLGNRTVQFSTMRRDVIEASTQRTYEYARPIPVRPSSAINGELRWIPGQYTHFISIAAFNSYVNRYTDPVSFQVNFLLREDCSYE